MPTHAAFLRGINLGSRRRISSGELRLRFEEMGYDEVATFRTSGNVVFTAPGAAAAETTARIERGLRDALGYEVAIFLRTASELLELAGAEPFEARLVSASKGKLQVSLLRRAASANARNTVLKLASDDDRLSFARRELFWLPSGGTRDSALDMATIEKLVGPTTMRTKGTIEGLAAKHFG